jgi:hypothetical protein
VGISALLGRYTGLLTAALSAIPAGVLGAYACVGSGSNTLPSGRMQDGATPIARLFGARWVVMGHTHEPVLTTLRDGATYVNLGSWGQDDPPDERTGLHESSCTFLVVQQREGDYHAELMRWHGEPGVPPRQVPYGSPNPMPSERAQRMTCPSGSTRLG